MQRPRNMRFHGKLLNAIGTMSVRHSNGDKEKQCETTLINNKK